MKNLVVLTGAGISAESGINTFRDSNGLWEGYDVMEVASIGGWHQDQEKVLKFYNQRRQDGWNAQPNYGHLGLVELEKHFDVNIVTQNVDNLHEKAGSNKVTHLHGELIKSRSTLDPSLIYTMNSPTLNLGDKCEKGSQLRPDIVWFGEAVPKMENAIEICSKADVLVIIGTSMVVYPAAGLYSYVPEHCEIFIINPDEQSLPDSENKITVIQEKATVGVKKLIDLLT